MTPSCPVWELSERETKLLPDVILSLQDHRLADQLRGEQGRVDIDELRTGIRVRARSWVDVLRFENFEVRIEPKLAGGNLNLVEMLALTSGIDALRRNIGARWLQPEREGHLLDLFALLLAETCERIASGGLLQDYSRETITPETLLLYPATRHESSPTRLQVRGTAQRVGATIQAVGIHIPQALHEIRTDKPGPVTNLLLEVLERSLYPSYQLVNYYSRQAHDHLLLLLCQSITIYYGMDCDKSIATVTKRRQLKAEDHRILAIKSGQIGRESEDVDSLIRVVDPCPSATTYSSATTATTGRP